VHPDAGEDEVGGVEQVEPSLADPTAVVSGEPPRAGDEQDLELDAPDVRGRDRLPERVAGRREPRGGAGGIEHGGSSRLVDDTGVAGAGLGRRGGLVDRGPPTVPMV
jgi:hypothetical protein